MLASSRLPHGACRDAMPAPACNRPRQRHAIGTQAWAGTIDARPRVESMNRVPFLFASSTPMAQRHRAFAWDASPLGPPQAWDAALKTLVPIMLASNQAMFIVWGPSRTLLYNDAYGEILG